MKCVYVLASSLQDFYYEQFYTSVVSLRLFNPDAHIILLCDRNTKNNLTDLRSGYEKEISELKVINTPEELSQKESSRWIKTSISEYVHDDFLFIDCDTIITDKLDNSFPQDVVIGAVLDTHVPLSHHYLKQTFQEDNRKLGFLAPLKNNYYFNGGLLFCRDNPQTKEFFAKWHFLWNKSRVLGNSQDMPSLNEANYELGNIIKELGGEWNCQISHNGLPYLYNAKIIHYYSTSLVSFDSPFILASEKILRYIKMNGVISCEIMRILKKPKSAFSPKARIISDQIALDVLESAFFSKLLWFRRKHQKLFNKFNSFLSRIRKPKFINA
jgi:hypothetical protein